MGVLLDSHALYWLVTRPEALRPAALVAIGECQDAGRLYVSPISAWELALATRKPASRNPVRLDDTPQRWFQAAVGAIEARTLPIDLAVATESAAVVTTTGHRDPGDCMLVATARVHGISLVTRDGTLLAMASTGFVDVVEC